jgi:hypothetical protein
MEIALLHKHFDAEHLEAVKAEMATLGAPVIKAVWSEVANRWVALEGCHRLRAAHAWGLVPEIYEVEYSDAPASELGLDIQDAGLTVAQIVDDSWNADSLVFEDE